MGIVWLVKMILINGDNPIIFVREKYDDVPWKKKLKKEIKIN